MRYIINKQGEKYTPRRDAILRGAQITYQSFGLYKKFPLTLSGGEQQRVAIARALVTEPNIILADEPTGNLDNENSENIISLLKNIAHDKNKCVIVVTHSREIADETDVEYIMSDGMIKDTRKKTN